MMDLSNLKPAKGAIKRRKRIGRGEGSGLGGTATKGDKGARSRAGYKEKYGFEGGQMPLQRRIPKFGFKNINRITYKVFNVSRLQSIAEKYKVNAIDPDMMKTFNLIAKRDLVKILGNGAIKSKLEIKAHAFSKSAIEAIEDAGGKAVKI